jgi:hypothetical protein
VNWLAVGPRGESDAAQRRGQASPRVEGRVAFDSLPEPKTSAPTVECIDLIHTQYAHAPRVNICCESGGLTVGRHPRAKDSVEERTARVQSKFAVDVAIQMTPKVPQQAVPELVDFDHLL